MQGLAPVSAPRDTELAGLILPRLHLPRRCRAVALMFARTVAGTTGLTAAAALHCEGFLGRQQQIRAGSVKGTGRFCTCEWREQLMTQVAQPLV